MYVHHSAKKKEKSLEQLSAQMLRLVARQLSIDLGKPQSLYRKMMK